MVFGFRRSRSHDGYHAYDPYGELRPGERIGRPLSRAGGRLVERGVILLSLLGGGWVVMNDPTWLTWSFDRASAAVRVLESKVRELSEATEVAAATRTKPPVLSPPASAPGTPATMSAAVAPSPAAAPVEQPLITGSLPPAAANPDEPADTAWQPPRADPADPLQVRAAAVGLHPDLSRALLARLSPEDYRNAGIAIKTALAETPDSGVFVWPRQRKPELAHFQIHFVAGAAPDCRRYVAIVTKDGWSTTALPMERCGAQTARAGRG